MSKQEASPTAIRNLFLLGICAVIIGIVVITSRWNKPVNAGGDYYGIGVMVPKHPSVTEPYDYGYVTDFPSASYLYIEFGRDGGPDSDRERSAQLISMLLDWQKVNPTMQVISTSSFVGWDSLYHRARTSGLLVTYQAR